MLSWPNVGYLVLGAVGVATIGLAIRAGLDLLDLFRGFAGSDGA